MKITQYVEGYLSTFSAMPLTPLVHLRLHPLPRVPMVKICCKCLSETAIYCDVRDLCLGKYRLQPLFTGCKIVYKTRHSTSRYPVVNRPIHNNTQIRVAVNSSLDELRSSDSDPTN